MNKNCNKDNINKDNNNNNTNNANNISNSNEIEAIDDVLMSNIKNMYDLLVKKELRVYSEAIFD